MEKQDYLKKFKRCLYEYTTMANMVEVGEDDEAQAPALDGGMAPDMGGAPADGAPAPDGGMAPDMGGDMQAPMGPDGGEAPMDGAPADGQAEKPEGLAPQGGDMQAPMGGDPNMADPNMGAMPDAAAPEGEDEEVIDVDDLTNSQEKTEHMVKKLSNNLTGKFEKLLGMLDQLQSNIDANNEHIGELRQEMEKRNPTPVEKMTLRAKDSYPFKQTPDEYWQSDAPANYSPEDDKNGENDPQYQITKADVDNINDFDSIYKSLDDDDLHMGLKDIFK